MSEEPVNKSFGLLRSLKKLIFEDVEEPVVPNPTQAPVKPVEKTKTAENVTKNPQTNLTQNTSDLPATDVKQMKIKVLEILERMNEPGIDFFEVWNAAAEMGSVDVNSIKAAFTSLRYVDKTLDKEKLIQTGRKYATALKAVIDKETDQKQLQKQNVEQSLLKEKASLTEDIASMEQKLIELREQLAARQKELQNIDHKIATGNTAVTEVIADINNALTIIEKI